MNWFGLFLVLFGVAYLVYSVIFRNKVTAYNRTVKLTKGQEDNFYKLQLYFAILNSAWIMIIGLIIIKYNIEGAGLILIPLAFYFVNLLQNIIGKKKGYIDSY